MEYDAVVIGVSAGGIEALTKVISRLRPDFPVPLIIVQHRSPEADDFLVGHLNEKSVVTVKEAEGREPLCPGVVYIAPPDYHLLIEEDRTFSLSQEERLHFSRPSIDVLFDTAADAFGPSLVGIILTGANSDGSAGLKKIKEGGGMTIVQDPATAYVSVMPKAAIQATEVDHILPLDEIGLFLNSLF